MFIDLVLLLRNQEPTAGKPTTAYHIMDLLFCILVDAPHNTRVFEELAGLEAVSRVLRGKSVDKDVR